VFIDRNISTLKGKDLISLHLKLIPGIGNLFIGMEEKLLYKIHIIGDVQGVGFRWSALRVAQNLNIKGFVKNLPSGDVYIEAEGEEKQLDTFVEWCNRGPGFGHVESVNADISPAVNYTDFRIEF
jgi:acylphosphatase